MVSAARTATRRSRVKSTWRLVVATISTALVLAVSVGGAAASTPVTAGYRDQAYGGGAFRPAGDKPQSKLWFTDGSWFAGMFNTATAKFDIFRLNTATHAWADTGVVVDKRDTSHADYLWDEATQTLIVASIDDIPLVAVAAPDDGLKVFKYSYNAVTNVYTLVAGFPRTVPGTTSDPNTTNGGGPTATIAKDSTGRLWTVWPADNLVKYSVSDDGGATWSAAAGVPAQGSNGIRNGLSSDTDSTSVVSFGTNVGVMWSDHDGAVGNTTDGFYFAVIAAGADPTVGGNWSLEKLPSLLGPTAGEWADNHVNVKVATDGTIYAVGKTGKDTVNCATNKNLPLVEAFKRTTGGVWSVYLVSTVGDCSTRPQIVLDEQLGVAYVFLTSPNGGGVVYRKAAPLSGADAMKFRGTADTTFQPGIPFIKSATETLIDDPTASKQAISSLTGAVVLSDNLIKAGTSNLKYYLHNEMSLPAADVTAPAGTVSINAGAASTNSSSVSVTVPATDAGSGVSLVRLSNASTTAGGVLTTGTSFASAGPVPWTLAAGDGTRTVYAQWRDSAGNWSTPVSDTIVVDTLMPSAPINRLGGISTVGIGTHLSWTPPANPGNPVAFYDVERSYDGSAYASVGTPTTNALNLQLSNNHTWTFRVRTHDTMGNVSAWAVGTPFKANSYPEYDPTVKYTGTWLTSTNSVWFGGKAKYSNTASSTATFTFTGNRAAWLSRRASTYGTAKVYINNVLSATVNLQSSTVQSKILVYNQSWSTVATRTIKIVVSGTAGHPTVPVDGFFVMK